jgi:hypothetical protein
VKWKCGEEYKKNNKKTQNLRGKKKVLIYTLNLCKIIFTHCFNMENSQKINERDLFNVILLCVSFDMFFSLLPQGQQNTNGKHLETLKYTLETIEKMLLLYHII